MNKKSIKKNGKRCEKKMSISSGSIEHLNALGK